MIASGPFLDWEEMTGLSKFWVDMISIPLVSVIAGVITNWTGVFMLFTPVQFRGFYLPGLKTIFPFLPRRVQVLPLWAPGGIIGYQGFIPARAEKLACFAVDKAIMKIGNVKDMYLQFEPEQLAGHITEIVKQDLPSLVADVMEREHPQLWRDMTPGVRETLVKTIEDQMPAITTRALDKVGENVEQMVDVRLMAIRFLSDNPTIMKDLIWRVAAPELKFMIRIGLLGLPFGVIFALVIYYWHQVPIISAVPTWVVVLAGAALIGVTVNYLAVKIVFEPAEPQPRYKYPWKQAKLAKRQGKAAADFGQVLATDVLTIPNIADELMNGPRGDRTRGFVEDLVSHEIGHILGPMKSMVRVAIGPKEFDALSAGSARATFDFAPTLTEDKEFTDAQAAKIERFATQKLAELPPDQFMDMIYSVIEQDAWLLYVHGAVLGLGVGAAHLVLFGA